MKRDFQRSKVYAWEKEALNLFDPAQWPEITLDECKALIQKVFAAKGLIPPAVKDGRGSSKARGGPDRINLPKWARTKVIVLHECAHGINIKDAHGPAWVKEYIDLLGQYADVKVGQLYASALDMNVKVFEPKDLALPAPTPAPAPAKPPAPPQGGSFAKFMDELMLQADLKDDAIEEMLKAEGEKRNLKTKPTLAKYKAHVKFRRVK